MNPWRWIKLLRAKRKRRECALSRKMMHEWRSQMSAYYAATRDVLLMYEATRYSVRRKP